MKQIILPFNTGKPELIEVPAPVVQPGEVLIRTTASVVSTGTERMLMAFGKAGYLGKLRQQPEKARQVLAKLKTDGLAPTIKAVRSKMDTPIALGYSQAGVVVAVGSGIHDIKVGDRVASNGAHAEIVSVPRNLLAKIPDGITDETGAFTVLGAIALQSIRLAAPTFGETVVVIGLGLIGQLTAQLLIANGCRVIGTDLQTSRLKLAEGVGVFPLAEISGDAVRALTAGHGADAVIITASSSSDSVMELAADICRKRGRIVLTGVVGMQLSREHFFKKELSFQVSSSYGPGRYERAYEQQGLDYPIGYVRWTEGRNFEAVLTAMQRRQLDVTSLISTRVPFSEAAEAYSNLETREGLATLFTYTDQPDFGTSIIGIAPKLQIGDGIGLIGAGSYAGGVLLPALKAGGGHVATIISKSGLSAATLGQKHGIHQAGTDVEAVFKDEKIGAVVIATPHHTHAKLAAQALRAGKDVFVEKPLALTRLELDDVAEALRSSAAQITIGFNRRFAPLAIAAKELLQRIGAPVQTIITVNAGKLPANHWLADAETSGGRLIGEACHFIDLCQFFASSPIHSVCTNAVSTDGKMPEDASILLRHTNGSGSVVNYFSTGSKAYDKERIELHCAGHTIIIENWRSLRSFGFRKDIAKRAAQDKGNEALMRVWISSLNNKTALPIPQAEILNSSLATLVVVESISTNSWISL